MSQGRYSFIVDDIGRILVQILFPTLNCLVLEGGGVRGTAYGGLARKLEKYRVIDEIEQIAGSSAGSIAALVFALGFTAEEIETKLCKVSMEDFLEGDKSWPITPDILAAGRKVLAVLLRQGHSLSSGNRFLQWLEELVEEKLGKKNATFRDLAEAIEKNKKENNKKENKKNRFKQLYVTGTNISLEAPECETFSFEKTPDMPLALAVRASSSFPFIFEPVKWNGHLYSDGGLMRNLPSRIFDDRDFIPPGYGFTKKGVNPGVLNCTIHGVEQEIWGKRKEKTLHTTKEIAEAIYNALSTNTDSTELREDRMVIPLPDGHIDTLQFTIDTEGKINLITLAEKAALEFLENHINAAYEIKPYANLKVWLEAQTSTEINTLIKIYKEMKMSCLEDEKNNSQDIDPNHPTREQLEERIVFLKKYAVYKNALEQGEAPNMEIQFPTQHINIRPQIPTNHWSFRVKNDMEERRKIILLEIEKINQTIAAYYDDLIRSENYEIKYLYENDSLERIKIFTGLTEHLKFLEGKKIDLENKLGIKNEKINHTNKQDSSQYEIFCHKVQPLLNSLDKKEIPSSLRTVLHNLDLYHPQIEYTSSNEIDNIVFTLDLKDPNDRKLYVIAGILYLAYRRAKNSEIAIFKEIYNITFPRHQHIPGTIHEFADMFGKNGTELSVIVYRLEELMNFFAKIEFPKSTPMINIDQILGAPKFSTIRQMKVKAIESEIGLKSIFKSHVAPPLPLKKLNSQENISLSTSKFSFVAKNKNNSSHSLAPSEVKEDTKISDLNINVTSPENDEEGTSTPSWFFGQIK